jgi:hypothetical protein
MIMSFLLETYRKIRRSLIQKSRVEIGGVLNEPCRCNVSGGVMRAQEQHSSSCRPSRRVDGVWGRLQGRREDLVKRTYNCKHPSVARLGSRKSPAQQQGHTKRLKLENPSRTRKNFPQASRVHLARIHSPLHQKQ